MIAPEHCTLNTNAIYNPFDNSGIKMRLAVFRKVSVCVELLFTVFSVLHRIPLELELKCVWQFPQKFPCALNYYSRFVL